MIKVRVDRMFMMNMGFVVLLKGDDDARSLPIFIGAAEAQAIALWIKQVDTPRPLTHDLMKNVLDCLEGRVHRVEVVDLKEGTFYANIVLDINGSETKVDARPSDAIALALRACASMYVSAKVMDEAGKIFNAGGEAEEEQTEPPESSELEQLKENLESAIADERYEEAAGIRDRIRELEHHTSSN